MTALEVLRERKRNREPLTPLEDMVLNNWYIESHNGAHPAPRAEKAAEDLARKDAVIDLLINNHIMNIHRMPHEGHGVGSYLECHHELCKAVAALKEQKV